MFISSVAVPLLLLGAATGHPQTGETNTSTDSPLVGARYDDNSDRPLSDPAILRNPGDRATARGEPASRSRPRPAKAADLVVGAEVHDTAGQRIGTISSTAGAEVVIDTGAGKASVAADAFGKDRKGLLLGMTRDQFVSAMSAAGTQPAP